VEPKQTKTGQEEDQQGKKVKSGRSKAKKVKQSDKKLSKNVKNGRNRGWNCVSTVISLQSL
jgi:hypothetical protein